MTTELKKLEGVALAIHDESDADQVCIAIDAIDNAKRRIREIDAALKKSLIDWINRNGDITIGSKRYYVGNKKTTKPRDLERLCEAAITAAEGDFATFADSLSANAFKPGACKKLLGDAWDRHFEETIADDVKTGKPKKVINMIDERFQ